MPAPPPASKVFAVHLNYRSRAEQRGRTPAQPSFFFKPPSSISAGGPVVRPEGAELLGYEGEIAIVIGTRAKDVAPEQAAAHIGWVAPANDIGLFDMRWADRGSNLMAKGQDGYTPIGPAIPAADVDLGNLHLRTLVNGEVVQDDTTANLLFGFAALVADLSRFFTLEPGDVILTGTPTGTTTVDPGDEVEVQIVGRSSVSSSIVAGGPLAPYGALPKATPEARALALGSNGPRRTILSPDTERQLREVSTATLTVQLAKRGVQATFMTGLRPSRPDRRMVGHARTLRYGAFRQDVRDAGAGTEDAQKRSVESLSPGDVLVMEARGERGAGTIGDLLVARAIARGAAGIVTDGGVRDSPGVAELDLPTYFQIANAESLWLKHVPLDAEVPITCAGVLVLPGDVLVGDAEGVIVLPARFAQEIADDAWEQEQRESFALERIQAGESIRGLYPLSEARRPDYETWRAHRDAAS